MASDARGLSEDSVQYHIDFYTHGELEGLKIGEIHPKDQKRFLARDWALLNKLWELKELSRLVTSSRLTELTGIEAERVLESEGKAAFHMQDPVAAKIRRAEGTFDWASDKSDHKGLTRGQAVEMSISLAVKAQKALMCTELIANLVIGGVFKDLKEKLKKDMHHPAARDKLIRLVKDCEKYHHALRTGPPPDVCSLLAELRDYGRNYKWDKSGSKPILGGKFQTNGILEYLKAGREALVTAAEAWVQQRKAEGKNDDASMDVSDMIKMANSMGPLVEDTLKKANGLPDDAKLHMDRHIDEKQIGLYMVQVAKQMGCPVEEEASILKGTGDSGDKTIKKQKR